jgi:hypothetical protein
MRNNGTFSGLMEWVDEESLTEGWFRLVIQLPGN